MLQSQARQIPFEAFTGIQPEVRHMHAFGTHGFVYVDEKKKLDARSIQGLLIGYDRGSSSSLVYFPSKNQSKKGQVHIVHTEENCARRSL